LGLIAVPVQKKTTGQLWGMVQCILGHSGHPPLRNI